MKDLKYYLNKALKDKFTIGAFNFTNLETLQAIAEACKETKSPAIIAVTEKTINQFGEYLMPIVQTAKKMYPALFLHLDHGKDLKICKKAVDMGFDSVMIDASHLPIQENISITKKVCNYAHKKGVLVEGELGQIKGNEDDVQLQNDIYTKPQDAEIYVSKTGVDMLAISIGTSHGAYKHKCNELKIDILNEIQKTLPNTALVLHGASCVEEKEIKSFIKYGGKIQRAGGLSKETLRQVSTSHNIVKVNTDTDIRLAFTSAIREQFSLSPETFDPRTYLQKGKENAKRIVKDKIVNIFLSNNKG